MGDSPEEIGGEAHEGTVVLYKAHKGFGFIAPDDGGTEDIFVSHQNIVMDGFRRLKAGERVRYFVSMDEERGKVYATHVVKIADRPSANDDTFEEMMNIRRSSNQRIKAKQELARSQMIETPTHSTQLEEEEVLAEKAKAILEAAQIKRADGVREQKSVHPNEETHSKHVEETQTEVPSSSTIDSMLNLAETDVDRLTAEKEANKRIAEEQVAKRSAEKMAKEDAATPQKNNTNNVDPVTNIFDSLKKMFGQ